QVVFRRTRNTRGDQNSQCSSRFGPVERQGEGALFVPVRTGGRCSRKNPTITIVGEQCNLLTQIPGEITYRQRRDSVQEDEASDDRQHGVALLTVDGRMLAVSTA